VEAIPLTSSLEIKPSHHQKWIARRQQYEGARHNDLHQSWIDLPTNRDVLLGRGKPIQNHPGMGLLRRLVDQHLDQYSQSKRGDKVSIASQIVGYIQKEEGRFLKRLSVGGFWVVASEDEAVQKVNHTFRVRNKKRRLEVDQLSSDRSALSLPPTKRCFAICEA